MNSGCPVATKPKPAGALEVYVSCSSVSKVSGGIDGASQTHDGVQFFLLLRYCFEDNFVGFLLLCCSPRLLKHTAALGRMWRTRMIYSGHNAGFGCKSWIVQRTLRELAAPNTGMPATERETVGLAMSTTSEAVTAERKSPRRELCIYKAQRMQMYKPGDERVSGVRLKTRWERRQVYDTQGG